MPSKKNKKHKKHDIMKPAPMLRKQVVTLKDVVEITANGNIGNGYAVFGVSPNGFRLQNAPTNPWNAAQEGLWDQYASMFECYQVSRVTVRFIPYKWEFKSTDKAVNARPTFSIIDPESTQAIPTTPADFYSYGNAITTAPYREHHRSMTQFMELAVQKQDRSLIKFTNQNWAGREQYGNVASVNFLVQSPSLTTGDPIGLAEYSISYVFSGQHAPGVSGQIPRPLPPVPVVTEQAKSQPDKQSELQQQFMRLMTVATAPQEGQ